MRKNKILEKLLAIILIFTLTSANFMFVTKSFASSFTETIFGNNSGTGNKNVEFEAYFGTEDEKDTSVISDVNNGDLAISMNLSVKNAGYLKDATIAIVETEEGEGLNFVLDDFINSYEEVAEDGTITTVEESTLPEYVQSIEDNVITLQQINLENELTIDLPIEYKNEQYVNENTFSNDCIVRFTGVYVDDDGEENEVSQDYTLTVSWKDERNVNVETSVVKYIDYEQGVIVQTLVRVDNTTENNTLPVKSSEVTIDVPSYLGSNPTNVTVAANTTTGTNGQTPETLTFNEENWYYNQDENKLTITVNNEKQLVEVNEYEDEYLKEADEEVIEEERYYNGNSYDEYLITYTYNDVEASQDAVTISSNIEAKMTTFSGAENEDYINIVTNNNNYEYSLEGKTGDIVSLYIETETSEVSKAYAYANYNNSDKYEVEFKTNTLINVSYQEIVTGLNVEDTENLYIDKEGNGIENNDLYYKQISISKESFDNLLGEEGYITVYDTNGNEIATINNETEVDENGFVVISFGERYSKLRYEISAPVGEGNLVINNVKAMTNATIDKQTLANVANITTKQIIRADYNYVENRVDVETAESVINLNDTTTKANLVLDRDSLSTLAENTDVELRIELNNAEDTSDMYGNSVYEIELPESVESIEVTNASILYGEGLDITSVELIDRTIRVTVSGVQEGINSGVLTNGTNIVVNANLKVNLYTPAKTDSILLRYSNDEATNYTEDGGVAEATITYSAPTGLVAVNSTYNYNSIGATVTSVRQGEQEDVIDIYAEAKEATMEIIVMNNNQNTVSNVSILGRIPFEGVKDIATGEDLGTTVDTKFVTGIVSDEHNSTTFEVYYSENGEATNDLTNENNGWVLNPESLENMKSYLIVPTDSSYEMEEAEILRFTYTYEIPAELTHNESIYGTFLAYYTNNSDVATTDEEATPDKVGLTTGDGPELEIEASVNKEEIKEGEEVKVTVVATNTGSSNADEVVVTLPIPSYSSYVTYECEKENTNVVYENNTVTVTVPTLERNDSVEFSVTLQASEIPTLQEYYRGTEGFYYRDGQGYIKTTSESGEVTVEEVNEMPDIYLELKASVTANDLGATIESDTMKVLVKEAELSITETDRSDIDEAPLYATGDTVRFIINVENLTDKTLNNVTIEKIIPEELAFSKAYIMAYEEDGVTSSEESVGSYDEASRVLTINIGSLDALYAQQLFVEVTVNELSDDSTKKELGITSTVKADGTDTYESSELAIRIAKPVLVITQTTETSDTYVKEGDVITYVFTVKNEGDATAEYVTLTDVIPDGLKIQKISYVIGDVAVEKKVSSSSDAVITANIDAGEEMVVSVQALASSLNGAAEKTVTNYATVSATNIDDETQTNSITHIIEANEEYSTTSSSSGAGSASANTASTNSNIDKTYKITGIAWLDSNENGTRDDGEELLTGISAKLVNSETGVIQKSVTTDNSGAYSFSGVSNGTYLIVFDYDTVKYTVTTYNKDGVASNVNSDALSTQVEQDGKTRNAAITDVITVANGSVSNIDIGLVYAATFDLQLTKSITKVTVQNSTGKTETSNYDEGTTLAKVEIGSKYVTGSVVYVEYTMTVSNIGDVAGYAKNIVDYMPEGMTFNSSLEANSGWYTGTDGNLYYTGLSDTELQSNESQTIKLVLTKQMTEDNTGIVNNLAEIYEDYNIYGISDSNSTPGNKAQGENDLGSADTIILIKTGEAFIYVSVIITTILLGSIVIFIAYNKIVLAKRKGGV